MNFKNEVLEMTEKHTRRRRLWLCCALGLSLLLLLAASSCQERQAQYKQGVYTSMQTQYELGELGEGWREAPDMEDNDLAFWNESLGAAIAINSTCKEYEDLPLKAMANHLVIGIEERRNLIWEQRMVDGREALYIVVEGFLDGVPIKVAAYVLVKDYCTFDLIYHAPPATFDEGLPQLHELARQFAVLRTGER